MTGTGRTSPFTRMLRRHSVLAANGNGVPSDVAEDSIVGGHGPEDGTVERRREDGVGGWIDGKDLSIGSLAGAWATENTRESIWDAMKRLGCHETARDLCHQWSAHQGTLFWRRRSAGEPSRSGYPAATGL